MVAGIQTYCPLTFQQGIFSGDGSSYYHSVYVVSVPGGSNPSYDLIYVAQHTYNYSSRKLTEVIGTDGRYMRQMRFHAGTFDK